MSILGFVFYSIILIWALIGLFAVYSMHNLLTKKLNHIKKPNMPLFSRVPCAARYDYVSWSHLELYVGALLILPPKAILMVLSQFGCAQFGRLNFKINGNGDLNSEQSSKFYSMIQIFYPIFSSICLISTGLTSYEKRVHKVSDYLADYLPYEKNGVDKRVPLYCSNHTSLQFPAIQLKITIYFLSLNFIKKIY